MSTVARRRHDERGTALIELTIVVPILVLVVFGIIEFGTAWGNKLKVETAARGGARVGSALGATRLADYNLLQSVRSVLSDNGLENVDYVVVFKTTSANGAIPSGCSGATPVSQSGKCNVYTGSQLSSLSPSQFSGTTACDTTALDKYWCPTARQSVQHLGPDYLGVWVKSNSSTLTNLFSTPLGLESRAVMRIEPK
jgi:Flp pilus assembly protein TadG